MNTELDTTETLNKYSTFTGPPHPPKQSPSSAPLRLRYFTPTELLRIFHFNAPRAAPPSAPLVLPTPGTPTSSPGANGVSTNKVNKVFEWPSSTTRKTRYRLIGNSANVEVIAQLLRYLVLDYLPLPP